MIHPTAIVDSKAQIGDGVRIGPWCRIGPDVRLGEDCVLDSSVIIEGHTQIGARNHFYHCAVIGTEPQDLKYRGEPTQLFIGDDNTFREFVTINRSATMDEPVRIGNRCLLMAYSHVAHNCTLGDGLIMANSVALAGHITIGDNVGISGLVGVHQFVSIGDFAFVGGVSGVLKDIPPYTRGGGRPYVVGGLNSVGLTRRGFSDEQIRHIKRIYRLFYRSGLNVSQAVQEAEKLNDLSKEERYFLDFVKNSKRGICRGRSGRDDNLS